MSQSTENNFLDQLLPAPAQYISVSRRTDVPRFYYHQFFAAWRAGHIIYNGGYGRSYTVSLRPEHVLGYLFWSKDFSHFLDHPDFKTLLAQSNALFGFTINDLPDLEPGVPPISQRLVTLARLCDLVGPERVTWRYDPVCKWIDQTSQVIRISDAPFYDLLPPISGFGVKRCIFSFITIYPKLAQRKTRFVEFTEGEKGRIASEMLAASRTYGVELSSCCNPTTLSLVPGICQARCVDDELLRNTDRFGIHRDLKIKPTRTGCGCYESRDIGSYNWHCPHGCTYCYANPCPATHAME